MNLTYFILLSGIAFSISCKKIPSTTPPEQEVIVERTIPSLKTPMFYADKLNFTEYSLIEGPLKSPSFSWDFSEEFVITYHFSQHTKSEMNHDTTDATNSNSGQEIMASGVISIESDGASKAQLSITDIETTMRMNANGSPTEFKQKLPPIVVQGFQENSQLSSQMSAKTGGLDRLFRLPKQPLQVGETIRFPEETPFNAMGSVLIVKGETKITHQGFVAIQDQICVQLAIQKLIDKLDIPEQLEGEYDFLEQEMTLLYFDIQTQRFVQGTMSTLMQFSIDAPNPHVTVEGTSQEFPPRTTMSMKSESLIQYSLIQ